MIILVVVCAIALYCIAKYLNDSENTTNPPAKNTPSPQTTPTPKQEHIVKKTVAPTGRNLSWDSTADICFALGSFITGLNASGYIGAYENGTLKFDIRNFSSTFNELHARVPSDIIDFLVMNPSILKRKQVGEITLLEIEFSRSYPINQPKTRENIENAASSFLEIVKANLQEGAHKTAEITGVEAELSFRIESPEYTASKILWIKS